MGSDSSHWSEPTKENREALRAATTLDAIRWQYTHGVADSETVVPDSYTLDAALMQRPGNVDIQLDLFNYYANNLTLYPAFQQYFRDHQPTLLAIWGKNDPVFTPAGAEAFVRTSRKPLSNCSIRATSHWKRTWNTSQDGSRISSRANSCAHLRESEPVGATTHLNCQNMAAVQRRGAKRLIVLRTTGSSMWRESAR